MNEWPWVINADRWQAAGDTVDRHFCQGRSGSIALTSPQTAATKRMATGAGERMMKSLIVALCAATAVPAAALQIHVTYVGVIDGGADISGVFTAPLTDLNGMAYRTEMVFDDWLGIPELTQYSEGRYGGAEFGEPSPAISATLTIAGVTRSILPDQSTRISQMISRFRWKFHRILYSYQ